MGISGAEPSELVTGRGLPVPVRSSITQRDLEGSTGLLVSDPRNMQPGMAREREPLEETVPLAGCGTPPAKNGGLVCRALNTPLRGNSPPRLKSVFSQTYIICFQKYISFTGPALVGGHFPSRGYSTIFALPSYLVEGRQIGEMTGGKAHS